MSFTDKLFKAMEKNMTKDKPTITEVQNASHEQLARWWRFLPIGTLQNGDDVTELIKHRLFTEYGGISTEISKRIGWEK